MTLRRIFVPALAAWLVDSVYGYVVFGVMLNSEFAKYPSVFRSFEAVSSMLPMMFASSLVAFIAVAYIFAKGHDGGSGLKEGFWFGIVFASYGVFGISVPSYIIYNYGRDLALMTTLAAFVEMLLSGIVLGLVYKPAAPASGRAARV